MVTEVGIPVVEKAAVGVEDGPEGNQALVGAPCASGAMVPEVLPAHHNSTPPGKSTPPPMGAGPEVLRPRG